MQRIIVFQQRGSGEEKIRGVREHGRDVSVRVVSIDDDLPAMLDDAEAHLPETIAADLVLDHLIHPDLTVALAERYRALGIPVVASGRRIPSPGLITPPTCCGLARRPDLGAYGEGFGAPELEVSVEGGRVAGVRVVRGAPCGATWDAATRILGLPLDTAATRYGLEVQLHCKADPSGWDPIHGKSPVHFAGRVHMEAMKIAGSRSRRSDR